MEGTYRNVSSCFHALWAGGQQGVGTGWLCHPSLLYLHKSKGLVWELASLLPYYFPFKWTALKRAGECKLAQIHETKRKQKEELENMEVGEMLAKARKNLQQEITMTTLIQNIFQVK